MRRGQVALYLVLVLVAVTFLALMNVGAYLSVTAKNRTMNAGDAAALAVARHQGELLNRIGQMNLDHLRAVLDLSLDPDIDKEESERRLEAARAECLRIAEDQRRDCFLGPLEGIRIGNEWARRNGIEIPDEEAAEVFRQHVIDIRTGYAMALEQFPEPWKGAWEEYAAALEALTAGGLYAAPDNIDFIDAAGGHLLLNAQFYNAIAGRNWCWFHFNAPGAIDGYSSFRDWGPLPSADDETRKRRNGNSEIYSLHLVARTGSAQMLFGRETIRELTGCTDEALALSVMLKDEDQVWYFYDTTEYGRWRTWWEIDPEPNEWNEGVGFPAVGKVKPEYDVRGCAATCRVSGHIPDVVLDSDGRTTRWTGAAKPFGTAIDAEGRLGPVTARNGLVLPSFETTRLVPWDAVGGSDTDSPSLDMVLHVRHHLPRYLLNGIPGLASGCFYCEQLRLWEKPSLHAEASEWLRRNSDTCIRAIRTGGRRGGTPHGH